MTNKAMLSILAAGLGVAGCAPHSQFTIMTGYPPPDSDYITCASNKCLIEITVTKCTEAGGITANIKALEVKSRNVKILWTIVSPNYKFADNGVVIKDLDPKREWDTPTGESPTEYSWKYKATPSIKKAYEYGVYVQRIDPPTDCLAYDPWVRN